MKEKFVTVVLIFYSNLHSMYYDFNTKQGLLMDIIQWCIIIHLLNIFWVRKRERDEKIKK